MNNLPQSLLDFVSKQLEAGATPETIRAQLSANNWKDAHVDQALRLMQTRLQSAPPTRGKYVNEKPPLMQDSAQILVVKSSEEILLAWVFRAGFAGIFLINGIIALLKPADFQTLLSTFPIAKAMGHIELMIFLAAINDLVLGSLILLGKARKYVWAWAGVWLSIVSLVKLVSLF